ncbi:MAG TPA: MBL fold metallo-hydrolase [Steroidobacteraceae bacterium]|nr:MBL fold metallo-hydrolase [Steroidobacteraceae bacterium]
MRTPAIFRLGLLCLVCCGAAFAQQVATPAREISVHRVAGNVYLLRCDGGCGANVVALVGSDGLVLVDAAEESVHQKMVAALRQLSDKPVRYVIDTHCHGDHTGGNASFLREGATVIAHRNVRARLAAKSTCGPPPGTGLPTITFDSAMTLYTDDEEIQITKLPTGHTDGDIVVYFKKANVLETGDAFFSNGFGGSDHSNNGTTIGVIDELRTILSLVPADAKIVPGHGTVAAIGDVRDALHTLEAMRDAIQQQIRAGKSLDEIRQMNVLSPWKDLLGDLCDPHKPCDHIDSEFYLRAFFNELTTAETPKQ